MKHLVWVVCLVVFCGVVILAQPARGDGGGAQTTPGGVAGPATLMPVLPQCVAVAAQNPSGARLLCGQTYLPAVGR